MPEPRTIVLAEDGILAVDHPHDVLNPDAYYFGDIVAISPGIAHDRYDIEFDAGVEGLVGALVAVRLRHPRGYTGPSKIDQAIRSLPPEREGHKRVRLPSPEAGEELLLGTGAVRLRRHTADGRPTRGERTAIGVGAALEEDQVRRALGEYVRLELRLADDGDDGRERPPGSGPA